MGASQTIKLRWLLLLLALSAAQAVQGQHNRCPVSSIPTKNTSYIDDSGTAHVTRVVPVPSSVSPEAQKVIGYRAPAHPRTHAPTLAEGRAAADASEEQGAKEALAFYPAVVTSDKIAGVPVRVIDPPSIPAENAGKVLINVHGGGFVEDWGSLTETIPVASLTKTKVISVLYRMAPEYPYPAAVDDTVAVYRELLKTYKPEGIGIYGTSAGATLTVETTSRLRQLGLPLPGVLGVFSGTGDLTQFGDTFSLFGVPGLAGIPESRQDNLLDPYVGHTNPRDPVLSPLYADLHGYPPTLFLSSTRDMLLSDTAILHRAFLRAGVEAQLVVFEALPHGFWNMTTLPESREANQIIANFFDNHLGKPRP